MAVIDRFTFCHRSNRARRMPRRPIITSLDMRITHAGRLYEFGPVALEFGAATVPPTSIVPLHLEIEHDAGVLRVSAWSADLDQRLATWSDRVPRCHGWSALPLRTQLDRQPIHCRVRVQHSTVRPE